MKGGEEERKTGDGKGFAGLSSLVSNVDMAPAPAEKAESIAAETISETPSQQSAQAQPSLQHQGYQEHAQSPSTGSSVGKWVLGIASIVGVLWLIGLADKSSTSHPPTYAQPEQTATPSYSPPAEPVAEIRPQESIPPVGHDLVFSTGQIQYCLAEEIRLEGAKSAANKRVDEHVNRFNRMIADYNSRCGSFRYRSGALESARRNIESFREKLQAEGESRFTSTPQNDSLSSEKSGARSEKYLNGESLSADDRNTLEQALSTGSFICPSNAPCEFEDFELLPVDVDMDGKNEYLVKHQGYCGSGGCSTFLYKESKAAGWKQIASAFGFVRIGEMNENGYRNLIVESKIYRTEGGFDLTSKDYSWDGVGYKPHRTSPR